MKAYSKKIRSGGFTLVELMVVVVIIGVLAGIAISVYSGYARRAKLSDVQLMLKRLWQCNEMFYGEYGYFYGPADDLGAEGVPEMGFQKLESDHRFIYYIEMDGTIPNYIARPRPVEDGGDGSVQTYLLQMNRLGVMTIEDSG